MYFNLPTPANEFFFFNLQFYLFGYIMLQISVTVLARKMIGVTEIRKASGYGKEVNANDKKRS